MGARVALNGAEELFFACSFALGALVGGSFVVFSESLDFPDVLEELDSLALGESCDAHMAAKLPEVRVLELAFPANATPGFEEIALGSAVSMAEVTVESPEPACVLDRNDAPDAPIRKSQRW